MANYYKSQDITIFPSSNAVDNGKVTSEQNIRDIVNRLKLRNYKMKSDDFVLSVSSDNKISITEGTALISGYKIDAKNITLTDYPTSPSGTQYYVVIQINIVDNKISGDINNYCEGIELKIISSSEYNRANKDIILVIGTASYSNGSWSVSNYTDNIYPFSSDGIMVDNTTNPPEGSITSKLQSLETGFVSSVSDDTKLGYLAFKSSGSASFNSLMLNPSTKNIGIYNDANNYLSESYNSIKFYNGSSYSSIDGSGTSISLGLGNSKYITIDSTNGISLNSNSKNISIATSNGNNSKSIELNSDSILGKIGSNTLLSIKSSESIIGHIKITNDTSNVNIETTNSKPIKFNSVLSGAEEILSSKLTVGSNVVLDTSSLKIGSSTTIGTTILTTGSIKSGSSTNNTEISNNILTITSSTSSNKDTINFNIGSSTVGSIIGSKDGNSGVVSINTSNASDDKSKIELNATNVQVYGVLTANKIYNAVYNGFGEIFRKSPDEIIEYGDVVCIGQDGLVHKMSENYSLNRIIGICSNTIGIELGGSDIPDDERVEVELIGKIWVKTDSEYILPGSLITFTMDGKAKVKSESDQQNAIALSNVKDGKILVYYSSNTVR